MHIKTQIFNSRKQELENWIQTLETKNEVLSSLINHFNSLKKHNEKMLWDYEEELQKYLTE